MCLKKMEELMKMVYVILWREFSPKVAGALARDLTQFVLEARDEEKKAVMGKALESLEEDIRKEMLSESELKSGQALFPFIYGKN